MKITIEISTDNAAFEEQGAGNEVARILTKLAGDIPDWPGTNEFTLTLRDINGNKVGTCKAEK